MSSQSATEAAQLLLDRRRARTSLQHYVPLAMDISPALHHRLICDHIDQLLDDRFDILVILAPPGSAKSTYTSHALPAYYLGRFPRKNIILATHTADLSERWSRKVRNTYNTREHNLLFPATLSKDSTAVSRWATSEGGEFLAAGVGAAILGFRADLGVIDDPIKSFEEAQNPVQLQKVHDWFENDFLTRLKPGGKIVLICQRLASLDMAGYLIKRQHRSQMRTKVLTIKMEAEAPTEKDPTVDPLARPEGGRLWPEYYTPTMVADAKIDELKWITLYQQRPPSDEGAWIDETFIRRHPPEQTLPPLARYLCVDLALGVNTGDYTVFMDAGVDADWNIYILRIYRSRIAPDDSAEKVASLTQMTKYAEILIDDDNASKVWIPLVVHHARLAGGKVTPFRVMPVRGQDKEVRASALRGYWRQRKVILALPPDEEKTFLNEAFMFPNAVGNGVDDQIDAGSLMGRRILQLSRPVVEATARPRNPGISDMNLNDLFEDNERNYRRSARI